MIHPRVCLHQVAFMSSSTAEFMGFCREVGIPNVTLATPLIRQGDLDGVLDGGPRIAVINHLLTPGSDLEQAGEAETAALANAIATAEQAGADALYLVSGGRGALSWEAAAQRFTALVEPCKALAEAAGVRLLVEPAMGFNADIHIAHTFDDTVKLAGIAGIDLCIDLQQVWFESEIESRIAKAMPDCGLVQVSDYVYGDKTTPCRAVPGDGAIPLETLIAATLEAGYEGLFDLELTGPRIAAEGERSASLRAAERLSDMLERMGA